MSRLASWRNIPIARFDPRPKVRAILGERNRLFNNYFLVVRHPCSNFDFLDSPLIRAQVDLKIKEP